MSTDQKTTALVPWFGSGRMMAENVGRALKGCRWVGVPCSGGTLADLIYIEASTLVVSDLHRHLINLATVAADPTLGPMLYRRLRRIPFHPEALAAAQLYCRSREEESPTLFATCDKAPFESFEVERGQIVTLPEQGNPALDWAVMYFVCCWMGRSSIAGTTGEFKGAISARWNANGGDSAKRFQSAVDALPAWRWIMRRANFRVMDVFDFLHEVEDCAEHGFYIDPPFPGSGDAYKYKFTIADHRRLAGTLQHAFGKARIVCRFYDHPLIREIYPESVWKWDHFDGRKQTNAKAPEVLISKGGA